MSIQGIFLKFKTTHQNIIFIYYFSLLLLQQYTILIQFLFDYQSIFSLQILLVSILNDIQNFLKAGDNQTCGTPDYPRNLTSIDSAYAFAISQPGMQEFIYCGLESSSVFFTQAQIPTIEQKINLGVTTIDFTLSDIQMQDLTVGGVDVSLNNNTVVQAQLEDCFVQLDLQWKFQQTSYPYVGDQGSGKIIMSGASLYAAVGSTLSTECEGHLSIDIETAALTFDALKIELSGGNSWIYQSMIDLIMSSIQDQISQVMSDIMCNSLVDLMNANLNQAGYYFPYNGYENIIKDDRFVSGWQIGYGVASFLYSGYIYNFDDLDDEYISTPDMIHETIPDQFNSQLQFSVDVVGFDNFYYIFNKYYQSYNYYNDTDNASFELLDSPKNVIENTCVLTTFNYNVTINGTQYQQTFQLMGQPLEHTDKYQDPQAGSRNVTQIYFNYTLYDSDASSEIEQYFVDYVLPFLNDKLYTCNYQIANTPFMDMSILNWYFDTQNQHLRLYGNTPDVCGVLYN